MKIALLDDKAFGMEQVQRAIPRGASVEFSHFSSARTFFESGEIFDILLLDFYLDHDQITSDTIFSDIRPRARTIIAFSSSDRGNTLLKQCGADTAIEKQWGEQNEDI